SSAGNPRIQSQKPLLMQIYDKHAATLDDPRALSRLAWAMYLLDEPGKAQPLLTRVMAMNPTQPGVRKEVAGVLAALDRRQEPIQLLTVPEVLPSLDITELLNLADLLTAENQLDRAEQELSKVVTAKSDKRSRVRYGSVLLWNGKYPQAQQLF